MRIAFAALLAAASVGVAAAAAQTVATQTVAPQTVAGGTVATGAGRESELSEAARIDAYLADAAPAPATERRVSAGESAASAGALPRTGALPPMDADSPWARGVMGPTAGPLSLADRDDDARPCDHKVHGEVGAEIGTGGERGGYGVATLPVGKDCEAYVTVGVGTQRGPRWRGRSGELTDASVRVDAPNFSLGVSGVTSSGRGGSALQGPAF